MTFRQLKAFLAVYEEGAFARAALREHGTQSGLSMVIRSLEEQLGVQLFERLPHGVQPTAAGRRYYQRCLPILRAVELADAEMRALAGTAAGRLAVGIMPMHARCTLAPRLARFAEANPAIELHVVEGYSSQLVRDVAAGELDLALVPLNEARDGLAVRPIGADREVLVSAGQSGLPHLAPVRLADLPPQKIILPEPQNARRRVLDAYFRRIGLVPARVLQMDSMMATFDLVARADWVTILPGTIVAREMASGGLTLNPLADPPLSVEYAIVSHAARALSVAGERCVAEIVDELDRLSPRVTATPEPAVA